jgi:hypothetical protein
MSLEGIGGVLGNCMSSHVCIRKLEDSHFPPHNNSYTYDPQIMRQTAKLDLVPPYPLHNMIHTSLGYSWHLYLWVLGTCSEVTFSLCMRSFVSLGFIFCLHLLGACFHWLVLYICIFGMLVFQLILLFDL